MDTQLATVLAEWRNGFCIVCGPHPLSLFVKANWPMSLMVLAVSLTLIGSSFASGLLVGEAVLRVL